MTRRHAQLIAAMKAGCRLWRYSTCDTGYLIVKESGKPFGPETVRKVTINAMIDAGLIEVDMKESCFRDGSGSDEVYKLLEQENAVMPGMKFFQDVKQIVVRKHESTPNNWWCQAVAEKERTGLWAYHEQTILTNRI